MFWRITLLFVLLPILELCFLWFLFSTSGPIGILLTLAMIAVLGILGAFLVWFQGMNCWLEFNNRLDRSEIPSATILNGIFILLAAILLLVPGLISSFLGILLLVPPIRRLIISHIRLRFEAYRAETTRHTSNAHRETPDVIDV